MGCNKQRAVCSDLETSKRSISEIDADIDEEWEVCVELKTVGAVLPNFIHDMYIQCYCQWCLRHPVECRWRPRRFCSRTCRQ
ncbi:hypothetical protein ZWY2020_032241 [Hordeum vulgare]|nr:hypothetical protein ZWY2020_032241 [Hordeum vulgare]